MTALLSGWSVPGVLLVAGLAAAAAAALYGRDMVNFYRGRRRSELELNMQTAVFAFASLGLAVVLAAPLATLAGAERAVAASVYLVTFGWLSGLGLAKLYKIVPFMTWLECYGPVLGRAPTPRVQDLVSEAAARPWFLLYFASVWTGTAALALGSAAGFRIGALGTLAAIAGITFHLVRARMLSAVAASQRFPEGALRPSLLYSIAPGAR